MCGCSGLELTNPSISLSLSLLRHVRPIMAAAVMTRRNKSHKVRSMVQPARLQLNGATLRETHASLSHSCEDCTSSGGSGSSSGDGAGAERIRQRKDAISLSVPTLSPGTQDSINLVFSFDMKGADFEESVREIWPRRCTFVVKELIETERVYVRALGDIIKARNVCLIIDKRLSMV